VTFSCIDTWLFLRHLHVKLAYCVLYTGRIIYFGGYGSEPYRRRPYHGPFVIHQVILLINLPTIIYFSLESPPISPPLRISNALLFSHIFFVKIFNVVFTTQLPVLGSTVSLYADNKFLFFLRTKRDGLVKLLSFIQIKMMTY
jgi:hypothetical protein